MWWVGRRDELYSSAESSDIMYGLERLGLQSLIVVIHRTNPQEPILAANMYQRIHTFSVPQALPSPWQERVNQSPQAFSPHTAHATIRILKWSTHDLLFKSLGSSNRSIGAFDPDISKRSIRPL